MNRKIFIATRGSGKTELYFIKTISIMFDITFEEAYAIYHNIKYEFDNSNEQKMSNLVVTFENKRNGRDTEK